MRVNLGCGRRQLPGWLNVDCVPLEGVEAVIDFDHPTKVTFPWLDDTVDEFAMIHVLEHIVHPLPLMEEAWRCAKPGATFTIACPYGSSDDADEDPTHVRRMFLNSFGYFSQPYYHRASYGYGGDWQPETITLDLPAHYSGVSKEDILNDVMALRNVVSQMTAVLRAVKPAREPLVELQRQPSVNLRIV